MSTNQGLKQDAVREITSTTGSYNEDWMALFDAEGIADGEFNGRFVAWLQQATSSASTNINDLKARFAELSGASNWSSVGASPLMVQDCELWVDATDNGTVTKDGSNLVSNLADKSGNGNDLTAAGGNRPTWTANQLSSLPTLNFDGSQEMVIPSGLFSIPNGNFTTFIVSQRASESGSSEVLINLSTGTTAQHFVLYAASSGVISATNRTTGSLAVSITGNTLTDYNIIRNRRSGVGQALAVNGSTEETNLSATSSATIDSGDIGASNASNLLLTGNIAEMLIYSRSLSTAELATVEIYLADKWGVYHPQAKWLLEYPPVWQTAIHNGKLNRDTVNAQLPNLYVLIGNSNTQGFTYPLIADGLPHLQGTISGVETWDWSGTGSSGDWETLEAGVNNKGNTSSLFGQEMNFAHFIAGNNGQTQYIVKSAIPSGHVANDSQLSISFHPVDGDYYGYTRARIEAAADALAAQGIIPYIAGYMVFLGGSDRTAARAPVFETNFQNLLDALLADDVSYGITNSTATTMLTPSLVGYTVPGEYAATVQVGIDAVAAANANVTTFDVTYAAIGADGEHLTEKGMADMGEQYAEFFTTITLPYSTTESRLLNQDAASGGSTITKDGSDLVSSMVDTDNAIDGVATLTERPLWVDNQMNGHPIIRYSGGQFLNMGKPAVLDLVGQTDAFTVYSIVNSIDDGTIIGKSEATQSGRQIQVYMENDSIPGMGVGGSYANFSDITRTTNTPYMFTMSSNTFANSMRGYRGSTESTVTSGDPGTATDTADWLIGARRSSDSNTGSGFLLTADVAQIMIFDGQHTARMVGKMKNWAENKWGTLGA